MLCTTGVVDDNTHFHIMEGIGQNQRRRVCFIELDRWRYRGEVCWLTNCSNCFSDMPSRKTICRQLTVCTYTYTQGGRAPRNVTFWRPSVCLSVCPSRLFLTLISVQRALDVVDQGAACDAASVHVDPSIQRSGILVLCILSYKNAHFGRRK